MKPIVFAIALVAALPAAAQEPVTAGPVAGTAGAIDVLLAIRAAADARLTPNALSCCDWGGSCVVHPVEVTG